MSGLFFIFMSCLGAIQNGFHWKFFRSRSVFIEVVTNMETIGILCGFIPEVWLTIQFLRVYVSKTALKRLVNIGQARYMGA